VDVRRDAPTWIVAAGKAAAAMAAAARAQLGDAVRGGIVIGPDRRPVPPPLYFVQGEHPEPGQGSERAGRDAMSLCRGLEHDSQLIVLISGGASALMAAPADGLTLDDKRRTTVALLRSGADIHALNIVRKHASSIKGGWLAACTPAASRTLAQSDVIGDDLSVIGSGPTVADASTYGDALDVLHRFGGLDAFPPALVKHLEAGARGDRPETPKPGDPRLSRSTASVIGGRHDAMRGAADAARAMGYQTLVEERPVRGEARLAARSQLQLLLDRAGTLPRPLCIVSSGETTVTVTGNGRGGRNQEFALASVDLLAAFDGVIALASVGTDGVDGPTPAAGALADSTTAARARAAKLAAPERVLAANDSHHFFARLGDLINTGPTGTNVGDLQIILIG
jgi:hydroxypyruvate reductase